MPHQNVGFFLITLTFLIITLVSTVVIQEMDLVNSRRKSKKTNLAVVLFPCNILCYIRILLVCSAIVIPESLYFLGIYQVAILLTTSVLLDLADGYLARRYKHQTVYGLVLDLIIDISTSTVIWFLSDIRFSLLFVTIEWSAVVAILYASFVQPYGHWKRKLVESKWPVVNYYFSNNQRNYLGAYGCIGHFVFPMTYIVWGAKPWLLALSFPGLILFELTSVILVVALVNKNSQVS